MTVDELLFFLIASGLVVGPLGIGIRCLDTTRRWAPVVRVVCLTWTLVLAGAWVWRTVAAGHIPLFGMYESAISIALASAATVTVWGIARRDHAPVAPLAVLVATVILAHGRTFDPTPYALTISERSWVVDVHAVLAWSAFGTLVLAGVLAAFVVAKRSDDERLDAPLVTALKVGFILLTAMIASGSLYKFMLFGSPWSFDPVESLALVVWMAYATLLHLHLFIGWRGRRLAAWSLFTFALLVVSYRCLVYFPPWSTYHIFDMDRRIHVGPQELGFGAPEQ